MMVDAKLANARYKAYCTGSDYFYCLMLIVLILDISESPRKTFILGYFSFFPYIYEDDA